MPQNYRQSSGGRRTNEVVPKKASDAPNRKRARPSEDDEKKPYNKSGGKNEQRTSKPTTQNTRPQFQIRKGYGEIALEAEERARWRKRGPDREENENENEEGEPIISAPDGIPAFASAVSKILARNVTADSAVLAKRHTVEEKVAASQAEEAEVTRTKTRARKLARRAHLLLPADASVEFERQLRKVATRGVVALFNAISTHQKTIAAMAATGANADAIVGKTGNRADAKNANSTTPAAPSFLELLRRTTQAVNEGRAVESVATSTRNGGTSLSVQKTSLATTEALPATFHQTNSNTARKPAWAVLHDDFVRQIGGKGQGNDDDDAPGLLDASDSDDNDV